jgi:hypothetical protein
MIFNGKSMGFLYLMTLTTCSVYNFYISKHLFFCQSKNDNKIRSVENPLYPAGLFHKSMDAKGAYTNRFGIGPNVIQALILLP